MTHFETEDGRLCLLLSDGMGCGEEARRESALAVRLLERFLRAGVETSGALKTLNSALTLRAEVSESFTTIDLLTLSLRDGAAEVYKYGAAPSYVKRGARVRRITLAPVCRRACKVRIPGRRRPASRWRRVPFSSCSATVWPT